LKEVQETTERDRESPAYQIQRTVEKQKDSRELAEKRQIEQITTPSPTLMSPKIAAQQQTKCHRSTFSLSNRAMFQNVVRNLRKILKNSRINSQQTTRFDNCMLIRSD
jgi:hypothetical protein